MKRPSVSVILIRSAHISRTVAWASRARIRKEGKDAVHTEKQSVFIGIDVSKDTLDFHVLPTGECWTSATTPQGIHDSVERIGMLAPACIVLEATGGLELPLTVALAAADLPVVVVNPRQSRNFARVVGILAKTDAIDARVLAMFAEKIQPPCRPLASEESLALKELITRRCQLIDMRTMETNRRKRINSPHVGVSIDTVVQAINDQVKNIDDEIQQRIKSSPVWREKDKLLQSVPGVGEGTSAVLMAALPELGDLTRREAANLAGLAPINRDSGQCRGKRMITGGRAFVRKALYMPTLTAIRYNPVIKAMYDRLIKRGKPPKVAITACMRKLLSILNALVRDNLTWQQVHP